MPPVEKQQADETSLEQALGEAFDEMEDGEEEISDAGEDFDEEAEEGDEETTAEADETDDGEAQEEEVSDELKEEIQDAADSDYSEPAPERWPQQIKEVYNNLPPAARKAMLEGVYKPMQAQYTRSTQELAQMRKAVEPMLKSLDQYRNDFERLGVNPVEAFQRQMAWAAHFARVGPEQGVQDMQAAYGLSKPEAGQQEQEYLTPVERAMKARLDAIEQQFQQGQQQQVQAQQQAQQHAYRQKYQQIGSELQDFINEQKDGKPAHPHVEKVAPAIAGLIRGGLIPATDEYGRQVSVREQLNRAYRMACDMDPSVRAASSRNNAGQVAKAKAAGSVGVVAKSRAGQQDVSGRSLAEELEDAYDRLSRTG